MQLRLDPPKSTANISDVSLLVDTETGEYVVETFWTHKRKLSGTIPPGAYAVIATPWRGACNLQLRLPHGDNLNVRFSRRMLADAELIAEAIRRLAHGTPPRPLQPPSVGSSAIADAPNSDVVEQLARLAELHRLGAVTDDEYAEAKARLLT